MFLNLLDRLKVEKEHERIVAIFSKATGEKRSSKVSGNNNP